MCVCACVWNFAANLVKNIQRYFNCLTKRTGRTVCAESSAVSGLSVLKRAECRSVMIPVLEDFCFWLERHCPSRICTTLSDGKQTVLPGSFSVFEGCCAQEEAWIVGKPNLDVAPRQCAGSHVAPHPQLPGKTSDIRCAPSTLFSGLSPSSLFPLSQT